MYRIYECDSGDKKELEKILEAEPYAPDSFARVGYKIKDGESLGEGKGKIYIYLNATEDFIKKADEKLKHIAKAVSAEVEMRIVELILKEEESVAEGVASIGSMFD